MKICLTAFTERGRELAGKLAASLGGEVNEGLSLKEWTARAFETADALVFVGAVGIAVRAIAPHIVHKSLDPAVVVIDEGGSFAVSLLSGHLGGANELARKIAAAVGAEAVITTATDVRGVFAVDEWARRQKLHVENPEYIKCVSAKLLAGERVCVLSDFPIEGSAPEGVSTDGAADVVVSIKTAENALCLVPHSAVLGVGCRRGTSAETIEKEYQKLLADEQISPFAVAKVSSIDIKNNEEGLLAFCERHGFPLETHSAEALSKLPGKFTDSDFVMSNVGVPNVCERSAVLSAGGELVVQKRAANGVTLALAVGKVKLNWNWRE